MDNITICYLMLKLSGERMQPFCLQSFHQITVSAADYSHQHCPLLRNVPSTGHLNWQFAELPSSIIKVMLWAPVLQLICMFYSAIQRTATLLYAHWLHYLVPNYNLKVCVSPPPFFFCLQYFCDEIMWTLKIKIQVPGMIPGTCKTVFIDTLVLKWCQAILGLLWIFFKASVELTLSPRCPGSP